MTYSYTDVSLGEYPGEISLIIYTGRCVSRCPWCFNSELLNKKPLSYKKIKDAIDEHLEFITAVVFTGGEPLLNPFLIKAIKYAKSKGLKVKMNSNGLTDEHNLKNVYIPYIDYLNLSLKGDYNDYKNILKAKKVFPIIPHCDILEYSFVYSYSIWPQQKLNDFHSFLKEKISYNDWRALFSRDWSQPDIFTVSQIRVGDCLNPQYNNCSVPNQKECINVASIFSDIPRKKLIVETKEYGRKVL